MPKYSYRCEVCKWEGEEEPVDAGNMALCPRCGVHLYPLPWTQTWGLALLVFAGCAVVIAGLAYLTR